MPTLTYSTAGRAAATCALNEGESVLDGLERHGVPVPNSCRAGVCQSCLMQASAGEVPPEAQKGLKDSLRARGYFMACACRPTGDLTIHPSEHAAARARAVIRRIEKLSHDVARVVLAYESPFAYFPGQFVNIVRSDGLMRSYSLANIPPVGGDKEDLLELHVRKIANGQMSNWLHDEAQPGQTLHLQGPQGDCFYVPGQPGQPMILAGTGTGLAPLSAIARDALGQGHTGPIRLYHGALAAQGLYLVEELLALAAKHPNFHYTRCLLAGVEEPGVRIGALDKILLEDMPKFSGCRVFLCGNPELVSALRKRVFLAGAKMSDIYADAFVMRAPA